MGKTVPKGLSIYPDFATNELKENPHQPYEWIIKLYSKNKTNNLQNREKGGKKRISAWNLWALRNSWIQKFYLMKILRISCFIFYHTMYRYTNTSKCVQMDEFEKLNVVWEFHPLSAFSNDLSNWAPSCPMEFIRGCGWKVIKC